MDRRKYLMALGAAVSVAALSGCGGHPGADFVGYWKLESRQLGHHVKRIERGDGNNLTGESIQGNGASWRGTYSYNRATGRMEILTEIGPLPIAYNSGTLTDPRGVWTRITREQHDAFVVQAQAVARERAEARERERAAVEARRRERAEADQRRRAESEAQMRSLREQSEARRQAQAAQGAR